MQLFGVETSNSSTPRRRCRHKNLNDPLRRSDACCPNCASWTDTSVAPLRSETERFAAFMVEENPERSVVVGLQNEANFSQSMQRFAKLGLKTLMHRAAPVNCRHRSGQGCQEALER
jgi:hypothetical protein